MFFTLKHFLTDEHLRYEIRDDLFEMYLDLVQNKSDHDSPVNLNYERDFSVYHVTKKTSSDFNLVYRIFFFKKVIATSQDSFKKLMLSLLNALSIWFDLVAFDSGFPIFLHKQLAKCKTPLGPRVLDN